MESPSIPGRFNQSYRRSPSHVPCESSSPGSRRLCAGCRLARQRASARLIPGEYGGPLVLTPSNQFRRFNNERSETIPPSASGTSSWTPPDASCAPFARSLTTTVFSQRSTGWFGGSPRRAPPKGQPSSLAQHRLQRPSTSFLLVAFVTHPYDGHRWQHRLGPLLAIVAKRSRGKGSLAFRDRSSSLLDASPGQLRVANERSRSPRQEPQAVTPLTPL